ncbi:MAG: sortase [Patescibacteria group bacterium]
MTTPLILRIRNFLCKLLLTVLIAVTASQVTAADTLAFSFTQEPQQIIIPSLDLALPVETAEIAYNTWEVSETTASFGKGSSLPGTIGNSVIFAHARPHLFGELDQISQGDLIHVFTDYDWFVYEVTELLIVTPENTEVIKKREATELTLFTCTGINDSHRFVVKAKPLSNQF